MARYRKVDLRIWNDEKFRRLSAPPPNAQTLWMRLLVSPHGNTAPGVLVVSEAGLADEMCWPLSGFRRVFAELERAGMVVASWPDRLVWVRNAIKYNTPESPNVVTGWAKLWDEVPECELKNQAFQHIKAFTKGLGEAFEKAFAKAFPEAFPKGYSPVTDRLHGDPFGIQEQEQEQEQEEKTLSVSPTAPDPKELQEVWNHETGALSLPAWRETSKKHKASAQARMRERPLGEWRSIIQRICASRFCCGENDRGWVATPDWLLQPETGAKVLEGKYDNRDSRIAKHLGATGTDDQFRREMADFKTDDEGNLIL